MTPDYSLVCPFLSDNPLYAQGVEFGMLYVRMRDAAPGDVIDDYFLLPNQDQITLAANRLGWRIVRMRRWDGSWFRCRMVKEACRA
jgi:hypothetical protein